MCGAPFWFGLVFVGLGLLNVISPETGWYLAEGWKFKGAEPSDAALVLARVAGVAMILTGLFVMLIVASS